MSIDCVLGCGMPLNPHDIGVWKEVTGFVGGPQKDSMRLRKDTGRYAHGHCVNKAQNERIAGQPPGQPDLIEGAPAEPGTPAEDVARLENLLED